MDYQRELEEKGFVVIENILSPEEIVEARRNFDDWLNSNEQIKRLHNIISPHGIFKHHEAGHQRHAWFIRTRPSVQDVFKRLWNTDDLVVSYDGSCWLSSDVKKKDNIWTHSDQAPNKKGVHCYQGFVTLTDNVTRSLVVYEGSHKLYEQYCSEKNLTHNKDWQLIDHDYLHSIADKKRVVSAKAGSLVLWDSRTFHQNQYGNPEERIVQYVCFLPKEKRSKKMFEKRQDYFIKRRMTSHWPYPVKVNGLQPQTYGKSDRYIDYSQLKPPELDDLMPEILKLI